MRACRRTTEELIARYELEPSLRDIYVEGPLDSDFFRWFVRACELPGVVVYEIDTVDIEDEKLAAANLATGRRGRVIWLAMTLADILPEDSIQVTFVVDRDLDDLFNRILLQPHLFYTDYSCLEMYFFTDVQLGKFVEIVASGAPHTPTEILERLGDVLIEVALLRAAKISLGWALPALELGRFCERRDGDLLFARDELVRRSLLAGSRASEATIFEERVSELRERAGTDCRLIASGHDFVALLTWYLRRIANTSGLQQKIVHRALVVSAELEFLRAQPMLRSLVERLS